MRLAVTSMGQNIDWFSLKRFFQKDCNYIFCAIFYTIFLITAFYKVLTELWYDYVVTLWVEGSLS